MYLVHLFNIYVFVLWFLKTQNLKSYILIAEDYS